MGQQRGILTPEERAGRVASRMALRCRVGISPQDRPPVPLATRSLLLRYGNAAGGEEDRSRQVLG
jgi:hypothetical protein